MSPQYVGVMYQDGYSSEPRKAVVEAEEDMEWLRLLQQSLDDWDNEEDDFFNTL